MPSTGTHYGLKQNFWFDSRRDVIAATDGALNYLQKLYASSTTGSWRSPRTTGAKATSRRAIERNQKAGKPTDYASLAMPDETRNYLPKLQAVKNIVRDPEKYGLELADIPDAPYFAVVKTTARSTSSCAAELAELSLDEFQYLNPHHNRPVIAGGRRIHDPAADRQGRDLRRQAPARPTSRWSRGRRTGCATGRRCAGRRELRHVE